MARSESKPAGVRLPEWCAPMTLDEYQRRAFGRPRQALRNLLHRDKYVRERRPPVGCWTVSGDLVLVSVEPMLARRARNDIPGWILEDTVTVAGQVTMKLDLLEDFLGEPVKNRRRWLGIL